MHENWTRCTQCCHEVGLCNPSIVIGNFYSKQWIYVSLLKICCVSFWRFSIWHFSIHCIVILLLYIYSILFNDTLVISFIRHWAGHRSRVAATFYVLVIYLFNFTLFHPNDFVDTSIKCFHVRCSMLNVHCSWQIISVFAIFIALIAIVKLMKMENYLMLFAIKWEKS